jgi:dTDP-4-dehydrorhamnose reductase
MKKILILGSTGMLGSMVTDYFSRNPNFYVIGTYRDLSVFKNSMYANWINKYTKKGIIFYPFNVLCYDFQDIINSDIDYIINCIGLIKQKIEKNSDSELSTIQINSLFSKQLAIECSRNKINLIQICTDCVFDGKKGNYNENDIHNEYDVYGKTKSLGETYLEHVINLRTSIVGFEINSYFSLLGWFSNLKENSIISGYQNVMWNGITVLQFAKICEAIIENDYQFGESGSLQHIIPFDSISKYQLLKIFQTVFDRNDLTINKCDTKEDVDRILSTLFPERNEELWKLVGYNKIPTICECVEELKKYIKNE